jgi:choline dehydrogenase-like flavoprotein
MALAVPYTLSPSKVASFKGCALAFRFSVIDRLPEPPSAAAAKGTLVHRALERLHCRPADERTVDAALADLAIATEEVLGSDEYRALELDDRERIRSTLYAFFHPVGTCAIGTVVDRELRVHGVENLYVGDASVMPSIPRANTHLTVLGIAEKLAASL